jgi:hypothetical protein
MSIGAPFALVIFPPACGVTLLVSELDFATRGHHTIRQKSYACALRQRIEMTTVCVEIVGGHRVLIPLVTWFRLVLLIFCNISAGESSALPVPRASVD